MWFKRRARDRVGGFNPLPGASEAVIEAAVRALGRRLPAEYVEYLRQANGGEGFVGGRYVILWSIQDLAELNRAYEVETYAPGLLLFGSNGGGEAYAFSGGATVVRVPFVGMSLELVELVGPGFGDLFPRAADRRETDQPRSNPATVGKEVFEIHPIILGGDPADPANKVVVAREQHCELVRYWNRVVADARRR